VYVVPLQTALVFVQRANIIRPTRSEHEEHFVTFCIRQFLQLRFPAGVNQGFFSRIERTIGIVVGFSRCRI
ncbi:MAG TPA: hypothetical protein VK208_05525, partial [Pyrinomonadaceae bacterium]|nr:hypothetical protein [Pyrinomonadaceae bacterium]